MRSVFIFLTTLLLITGKANANTCKIYPYQKLYVVISNTGTEHCTLVKQDITKGVLLDRLPSIISADAYVYRFTLGGKDQKDMITDVKFTYQCGENKTFTLHMRNMLKPKHKHTSATAEVLDVVDVFEKHTVKQGKVQFQKQKCLGTSPKIVWQLSN